MKAQVLLPKIFNFTFTYNSNQNSLRVGDFVEVPFGKNIEIGIVWPGNSTNLKNIKIYGFDTFQGVPEPTKEDIDIYGNSMKKRYDSEKIDDKISNWNLSSIDEVKLNYFDNTVDNENLILIKGDYY